MLHDKHCNIIEVFKMRNDEHPGDTIMKFKKSTFISIGFAILLGPTQLLAQGSPAPGAIEDTNTGHWYLFVADPAASWADASAAASSAANGDDYRSYLATVTSSDENTFIFLNLAFNTTVWLGGFQLPDATQADEGWRWTNNDGVIPAAPSSDPFENWATGEPTANAINNTENFLNGALDRDFLLADYAQGSNNSWYAASLNGQTAALPPLIVDGYVVEFEPVVPEPVEEVGVITDPQSCKENQGTGQGCTTIPEHRIILPASAQVENDATIVYRAWYFDDPRVTVKTDGECDDRRSLDVFAELLPNETDLHGDVILQEYLCGSPRFAIVRTFSPEVTITEDTVKVIQDKLEDNLFECDPSGLPPGDPGYRGIDNPQFRDVGAWRSTRHSMLEEGYDNEYKGLIGENWEGSASERTNNCGSSEYDTEEKSYFGLGLHIDFGPGYYGPENTLDKFVLLTYYKLLRLRDNVEIAVDDIDETRRNDDDSDSDRRTSLEKLRRDVRIATEKLLAGDYAGSLARMERFLQRVDATNYKEEFTLFNRHGELKSRGLNIAYTLREKIIPFAP